MALTSIPPAHTDARQYSRQYSRRYAHGRIGFGHSWGVWLSAGILILPIAFVMVHLFTPNTAVWEHLVQTVLGEYVQTSLLLTLGVGIGSIIGGVGSAWLVTMCRFPARGIFEWALLLPLAMPTYIIAYTFTGLLDIGGPVQHFIRTVSGLGYGEYWFPDIRSLSGAIVIFTLVLYPYVYLLSRVAFLGQSICALNVSRSIGNGPWRTFFTVALPLARPAIVVGVALVMMETLADFGAVQYFGLSTFSTGIFRTWYGLGNIQAAQQLAAVLMLFVLFLLFLERRSRRDARFHATTGNHQDIRRHRLTRWQSAGAILFCLSAVLPGFVIPATQLLVWSVLYSTQTFGADYWHLVWNSVRLAASVAFLCVLLALFLGYARRRVNTPAIRAIIQLVSMGYAVPGVIIAIGVISVAAIADNAISLGIRTFFHMESGLVFGGTLVALIFACVVRFLPLALQTIIAGLEHIRPSLDEAGRSFGLSGRGIVRRIHMPILRGSLWTSVLLVFVDVLKELPATLILRPFGFNTLAVRAYDMASQERIVDVGPAALSIVLAGIIPVILLSRSIQRSRRTQ